jgi:hypothetical protein
VSNPEPRTATSPAGIGDPVTIDEILVADEPETWRASGFHVDSDGVCRVGHVRIRLVGRAEGKRIVGWSLRNAPIEQDGLDGLPTTKSTTDTCQPATHANGSLFIDHIVLLTPDTKRTIAAFEGVGLAPKRSRETDQYGAPFVQTFFRAGEVVVELIGPAEASDDGPARFFGLAHTVEDIDATKTLLGAHLGNVKDAVQPGRRISTLRHKELDMSVATAFMSPGADSIDAEETGGQ